MSKLSPMMKLYMETKNEYKDCILFYRLGDFYEMFFDDALIASKELEITLTGKNCGLEERAPMCGVPFHAVGNYLDRLVGKGYKVAVCEQVEDPKEAKGLVKREVTRIVTPGTNISDNALSQKDNNYLCSIYYSDNHIGISVADVTTGDYLLTEVTSKALLMDELGRLSPLEIVCNEAFLLCGIDIEAYKKNTGVMISALPHHYFDDDRCRNLLAKHFNTNGIAGLGILDFPNGYVAAGALLQYLYDTQKNELVNITHIYPYMTGSYMLLDGASRRNLELTETIRDKQKRGSLSWVLDKTKTAMGSRRMTSMIKQPLINIDDIQKRLDMVECLTDYPVERDEVREYLGSVYDLERLMGKVSFGTVNPRDLLSLAASLQYVPAIRDTLIYLDNKSFVPLIEKLDCCEDIYALISRAIADEPPISVKEGGFIREGYSPEVDELKRAKTEGRQWILDFEAREQEKTGIKTLHVKYNKVFGYCIEISNSFKDKAPDTYIRKQTLTTGERFTNEELKKLEDNILGAEEKLYALEFRLFCDIREYLLSNIERVLQLAKTLSYIDAYASLSLVASQNRYVRPKLNDKGVIKIKDGRHPVVEKIIGDNMFVVNDTLLDTKKNLISVITGPNMAGKSTYMRQTALIVLMAQIGSFVPAKDADIGVVDRIFTRVGASDDLASGQSTFMVEMNEVANILRNATSSSLIILDEIGRGTSTFDGLSIAWAVVEHIANTKVLGAKTLFATHYHELTELEDKMPNVNNYCIAVKEDGDDIVFLRKIVKGGADKSYGIQVARLAGVPELVTNRAKEIAATLIDNDIITKVQSINVKTNDSRKKVEHYDEVDLTQMSLFCTTSDDDVLKELKELDISNLTPLDALNTLSKLQNSLNNRWSL